MHAQIFVRPLAGTTALLAVALGAFAAPAEAAVAPTAILSNGTVTVSGTIGPDAIQVTLDATRVAIDFGANGTVDAQFRRSRFQRVQVQSAGGNDAVTLVGAGEAPVTIGAGSGNDGIGVLGSIGETGDGDALTTVSGDGGNDNIFAATPGPITIRGGAGDDVVDGGGAGVGRETILLGDGNDRFVSSLNAFVGTRTDVVDGGLGVDTLKANGTFASEGVSLTSSAGHLIIDHDLRNRIDADNVENVAWTGFGGQGDGGSGDAVAVNNLAETDVVNFTPDFTDPLDGTGPNNSSDTLTVRATALVDRITVSGSGANITVTGTSPSVTPVNLAADDFLRIETLAGNDIVTSTGLQRGLVQLLVS